MLLTSVSCYSPEFILVEMRVTGNGRPGVDWQEGMRKCVSGAIERTAVVEMVSTVEPDEDVGLT